MMTESIPLLAICVPTFNRRSYLEKFLGSVLPQIEEHELRKEIVVVIGDNDSTDDTAAVVKAFQKQSSVKIHYHKNATNVGAVNNILQLVENCTAQYLTIFGDDDEVVDGALPKVFKLINENRDKLVFHFKCRQTDFIEAGSPAQLMSYSAAAEKYFYNLGNAGTFFFSTEKAKAILLNSKEKIASTCWPQTELMISMLVADKAKELFMVSGIELVSSDSHNENVIYNTWYIIETFCFSLLRVAQNVAEKYHDPALLSAARKSIPGCKDAIRFFFRVILFAAYYDYGYELEKTKELIRANKKQLSGMNYLYPLAYAVLIALPRWLKKSLTAFYFLISNKSFKKSKFDDSYAAVKEYQRRKHEVYKQKGKLTEDSERYIY